LVCEQRSALIQRDRVMSVRMRVDPANNQRVLLTACCACRPFCPEGGLVEKGGQNSDEALVASRFLSGHAARPDRPKWAISGSQP
jgi:hypothetical protein